jgi:hypothetical protein
MAVPNSALTAATNHDENISRRSLAAVVYGGLGCPSPEVIERKNGLKLDGCLADLLKGWPEDGTDLSKESQSGSCPSLQHSHLVGSTEGSAGLLEGWGGTMEPGRCCRSLIRKL